MKINFCLNSYSSNFNNSDLIKKIKNCFKCACKAMRQNGKILSVNIEFLNNSEIKKLNKTTREVDSVTDVLSYPMLNLDGSKKIKVKNFKNDYNKLNKTIFLGDIFINLNRAMEQSENFGHSFEREVCYLAVHGLLHLFGLDHVTEKDKKIMRAIEEYVMEKNNLKR